MNVLVLGATGMAGHVVSIYLKERGYEVTAFARKPLPYDFGIKSVTGDIHTVDWLLEFIRQNSFDTIVNCIGILNESCEDEVSNAVYTNSYFPHLLADNLKNVNTKIIHMSTDCVFSGEKGHYLETSFPDGRSFYDRTKALGELKDSKNLTFRNSVIGPDMNFNGIGLFNWFMKQEKQTDGYCKAIWTGVTTVTLAKAIEAALSENVTGIYHLVNNETISKYQLLCLFNRYCRDNTVKIHPCNKIVIDKSLINTRTDFHFEVPSYEDMILEMDEWIKNHKKLYPHYFFR